MKKILLSIFLFFIVMINDSIASHAMGADLTYRCLGGNVYEVKYTFYRDCAGIPAPPTIDIQILSSCFTMPAFNLNPTSTSPTEISPICPSDTSYCNGGMYIGIEEWIYQGQITLPGPCHDWTFSHSENARNASITTITGSGSDDLFVYSFLNNTNGLCNNSPTFSNLTTLFTCEGQQFCFNHGAFDIDGDSITYQIITPRNGPNLYDTVSYLFPYSASQPLISNPPAVFNPSTGDFCFTPIQIDVTVFAILVNEYRNGILIGQVERDLQITVLPCNNIMPSLNGPNGFATFQLEACSNQQNCFYIESVDPDISNTTVIDWDSTIPNMIFSHTQANRDVANFCWTPTSADTANNPHCFTLTVRDDNCPYMGIQTYSVCINVNNSPGCIPLSAESFVKNKSDFKIFPQPSSGLFIVEFGDELELKEDHQINIENVLSINVFKAHLNEKKTEIDLTQQPTGIYFIRLTAKNGKTLLSKKVIICR
jgi:hypothetical protein